MSDFISPGQAGVNWIVNQVPEQIREGISDPEEIVDTVIAMQIAKVNAARASRGSDGNKEQEIRSGVQEVSGIRHQTGKQRY